MPTAEELIVAIQSEGVGETQDDLEGVEQSMEQTAESAGDSADELEGFSNRFKGAMGAAVAALGVAVGGLLTQVPVLGSLFGALGAVVSAIALKMDTKLRPALTPIINGLFDLANAINEGDYDKLQKQISGIGRAITNIDFQKRLSQLQTAIVGFANDAIDALSKFAQNVSPDQIERAAERVINILESGFSRKITNVDWGQLVTAIVTLLGKAVVGIGNALIDAVAKPIIDSIVTGLENRVSDVEQFFSDLGSDITDWADDLAADAFEWGKSLIQRFKSGIQTALSTVRDFLGDLRDIGASVGIDVPDLGSLGGGGGGGGGTGTPIGGGGGGAGTRVNLDGRDVSDQTGRYRSDPLLRRFL